MLDKKSNIDEKHLIEVTDPKSGQNYCIEIGTLIKFVLSSIPKKQSKKKE